MDGVSINNQAQATNNTKPQKSKVGGYTGLAAGGVFSAYKTVKFAKFLKSPELNDSLTLAYNNMKTQIPEIEKTMSLEKFIKGSKRGSKIVAGVMAAATLAVGFALGKIADKVINHHKAKKAQAPTAK